MLVLDRIWETKLCSISPHPHEQKKTVVFKYDMVNLLVFEHVFENRFGCRQTRGEQMVLNHRPYTQVSLDRNCKHHYFQPKSHKNNILYAEKPVTSTVF